MEEVKESPSWPSRRSLFYPTKRSRRPRPFLLVLLASLVAASVALFVFTCKGFCSLSIVRNFSSGPFAVCTVASSPPPFSQFEESSASNTKNEQRLHLHGRPVAFGVPLAAPVAQAPHSPCPSEDSATFNVSNGCAAVASEAPLPPSATEESAVVETKPKESFNLSRASGDNGRLLNHSSPPSGARTFKWPKQSRDLLRDLRPTAESRRFAGRADEFFQGGGTDSSCKWRFFMTWLASVDAFGRRDLLVMESLFKFHRDACLLIVSSTMDSDPGAKLLKPFVDHGFRVAAMTPDFDYFFESTPAKEWFKKLLRGKVYPGDVPLGQNLSNLLRLAILYKFGGVYLDTDVIILRSFKSLRNSIGTQSIDGATGEWTRLNNAVLVFDKRHPLLYQFIEEFSNTFDGSIWGFNGPYLVSRVVTRLGPKPELNFTVLPRAAFYPVDWIQIKELFKGPQNESHSTLIDQKLNRLQAESFAVHLWNKESKGLKIEEGSVIRRMLSRTCLFCNASESTV